MSEFLSPFGTDTMSEFLSPSSTDTMSEFLSPCSADTMSEFRSPCSADTMSEFSWTSVLPLSEQERLYVSLILYLCDSFLITCVLRFIDEFVTI